MVVKHAKDGRQDHCGVGGDDELALRHMNLPRLGADRREDAGRTHVSVPKTASIFSFSVPTVNGLTR